MNFKPEEKAVGKENFLAALGSACTRRSFLRGSMAATASGTSLGAYYFGYRASIPSPVRIGVIGTGDQGCVLLGAMNPRFHQVAALCDIRPYGIHRAIFGDVYSEAAHEARPGLLATYGWSSEAQARRHVRLYQDYRELLADPQIEAVVIALPLHLHASVALEAMEKGKHVFVEKLMAKTVLDCKRLARTAAETGRILAVGHQRHYNVLYENAVETVRSGLLGELHYVQAHWHRGNLPGKDSWQMPLPPKVREDDRRLEDQHARWKTELARLLEQKTRPNPKEVGKLAELQGKIAQIEAQMRDREVAAEPFGYQPKEVRDALGEIRYRATALEELIRWRLWARTGGGLMVELGSHQLDAAGILITAAHQGKVQHPLSVSAIAPRSLFGWDREIEDHIHCLLEFPAPGYQAADLLLRHRKITVAYGSINGNGLGGYGETAYGTKGTLILAGEKEAMLFKESDTASKITVRREDRGSLILDTQASSGPDAATAAAALGEKISRGYTEELEHWAWCIRHPAPENQPRCHAEVALADAVIALATNVAARSSSRIEFKPSWFDVTSDETPDHVPAESTA